MRLSALLSLRLVLPTAAVLVSACAGAQPSGGSAAGPTATMAAPAEAPKLIVLIVVDQLRGEMLDRYRPSLSGGYLRLMNEGAWYSNAFQDHAITETAPGHASVLSGRFPASTGIISNSAGVIDSRYPLVTGLSSEVGASPDRFQGTTLVDWLVARDARSRALSVSAKDRAAILPVGRSKQEVYWYSVNGSFTTSDYYRDSLPPWVVAFNGRRLPHRYAGAVWDLAKSPSAYPEPDSVVFENRGSDFVFPHAFPADSDQAASVIRITPTIDSITALFALEGLERLALGRGPQTDVMSVSFSATDYIGHQYGPDSREAHDNAIRLDQTLAWFLDSLFKVRDPSTVMIALTGDHGVQPIPELARERGLARKNEAQRVTLRPVFDAVREYIRQRGGDTTAVEYDIETFSVDRARLSAARINPDSILDGFRRLALTVPGVARVDRLATLRRANLSRDAVARRWVHQIPPGAPVDLVVTLTRYSYWNTAVATHGSPYDQDASVPIIFHGPWVKAGRYTTFVRTVDIGVTLAAIAGVTPLERVDGVVLRGAMR